MGECVVLNTVRKYSVLLGTPCYYTPCGQFMWFALRGPFHDVREFQHGLGSIRLDTKTLGSKNTGNLYVGHIQVSPDTNPAICNLKMSDRIRAGRGQHLPPHILKPRTHTLSFSFSLCARLIFAVIGRHLLLFGLLLVLGVRAGPPVGDPSFSRPLGELVNFDSLL